MLKKVDLANNKFKFYIWSLFRVITFYPPIVTLFFKENGLTFTQIMLLQTWYTSLVLIFNIPTSVWADMVNRKKVLVFATALNVLGYSIYGMGNGFMLFLVAETFLGFSVSLLSGVAQAYFYEMLTPEEKKKDKQYFATLYTISMAAGVVGNLTGSLVANQWGNRMTFWMSGITALMAFCFALILKEDQKKVVQAASIKERYGLFWGKVKNGLLHLKNNKVLLLLVLQSGLIGQIIRVNFFYTQAKLTDVGLPVTYFGLFFAGLNLMGAIFVKIAPWVEKKIGSWNSIYLTGFLLSVSFILIGFNASLLQTLLLLVLISLTDCIRNPLFSSYFNRLIHNEERATILSFMGVFNSLFYMVMSPILGYLADHFSLRYVYLLFGVVVVIALLVFQIPKHSTKVLEDQAI